MQKSDELWWTVDRLAGALRWSAEHSVGTPQEMVEYCLGYLSRETALAVIDKAIALIQRDLDDAIGQGASLQASLAKLQEWRRFVFRGKLHVV